MMASLKPLFNTFIEALGVRLASLGFPPKLIRRTLFFQMETQAGYVGVHVNPIYRQPIGIDFSLTVGASISSVQEILEKTELYDDPSGLTWTFGILLSNLVKDAGAAPKVDGRFLEHGGYQLNGEQLMAKIEEYGTDDGYVSIFDDAVRIDQVANRTFGYVRDYGWPLLKDNAFTEEQAFAYSLRTDKIADLCFPIPPKKPLTSLILARKLGHHDMIPIIVESTRTDYEGYAKLGNPKPLERFERVAKSLGFTE
jgi:hypothetical protein